MKTQCNIDNCPILLGFEVEFQGEDDEKEMREILLPLIERLYKMGTRIKKYTEEKK